VYECIFAPAPKQKQKSMILDFSKIPLKGAQSRGLKLTNKKIIDFKFLGASTDPAAENPDIAEKTAVENQNIVEKPLAEAKTPHKGTTNKASASVPHPQPQPPHLYHHLRLNFQKKSLRRRRLTTSKKCHPMKKGKNTRNTLAKKKSKIKQSSKKILTPFSPLIIPFRRLRRQKSLRMKRLLKK
jgi:hypothetical protein